MLKINIFFKETIGGWDYEHTQYTTNRKTETIYFNETKNTLWDIQKEILQALWLNQEVIKTINEMLKWEIENPLALIKLQENQEKLYQSPDKLQHILWLVIEVYTRWYDNIDEFKQDITEILDNNKLPMQTKILLVKNILNTNAWTNINIISEQEELKNLLISRYSDKIWAEKIIKEIAKNDMVAFIDPQDGKIAYSNMFV